MPSPIIKTQKGICNTNPNIQIFFSDKATSHASGKVCKHDYGIGNWNYVNVSF